MIFFTFLKTIFISHVNFLQSVYILLVRVSLLVMFGNDVCG